MSIHVRAVGTGERRQRGAPCLLHQFVSSSGYLYARNLCRPDTQSYLLKMTNRDRKGEIRVTLIYLLEVEGTAGVVVRGWALRREGSPDRSSLLPEAPIKRGTSLLYAKTCDHQQCAFSCGPVLQVNEGTLAAGVKDETGRL
jgi:hypothetical protein